MYDVSVKILLPDLCGVVLCDLDLKTVPVFTSVIAKG